MSEHICVRHGGRELSGVARADESWAKAARRIAASVTGDPVALDLSGEVKLFCVEPDVRVALRPMTRGDLPDVSRWRSTGHVHRWWATDGSPDLETVTAAYGPDIDGQTPTRRWVVEVNGRSIGFIQDYRIADYPDFALLAGAPDAIGLDYAIGEEAWLGRGIGVRMLWAWIERTRHRFPQATTYFAAPDHRNAASLRILAKAGFVEGVWFDEPQSDGSTATVVGNSLDVLRIAG
ncbi:RimJ/RimL family protein N-acetyltransferase [Nocardioides daedukensis]|uniref:RimJ/RimL family protein N-acetyltransferase n=1 Tax=Nocardioides daedukensis TaxID=634462 RepID=A0A7Y9RYZ4_9ACTN|nr:GNAT family N-acetyltransferase [Nocardioides daedukensis]NYG57347.1 RimJ/RimL family protein N-acetyltransferase [Nocardioides daedukensis]